MNEAPPLLNLDGALVAVVEVIVHNPLLEHGKLFEVLLKLCKHQVLCNNLSLIFVVSNLGVRV